MSLVRTSLVAVVATALAATMLGAAPASARPAAERDGDHFPAEIDTTVPAGGSSLVTTPRLSKQAKKLTVTVTPQAGATEPEADSFDQLTHVLGSLSKGKKLLVCIMIHNLALAAGNHDDEDVELNVEYSSMALLMLGACLRMAGLLGQDGSTPARPGLLRATGASCGKESHSIPAQVAKTESGYQLTADGTTSKTKKPKLRVSCRATDGKFVYKIRATKKGTSLRKLVGKKLSVGIQSPSDASTGVPVTVRFATP